MLPAGRLQQDYLGRDGQTVARSQQNGREWDDRSRSCRAGRAPGFTTLAVLLIRLAVPSQLAMRPPRATHANVVAMAVEPADETVVKAASIVATGVNSAGIIAAIVETAGVDAQRGNLLGKRRRSRNSTSSSQRRKAGSARRSTASGLRRKTGCSALGRRRRAARVWQT